MRNTPSTYFCGPAFGSAATARSSRGIASAYLPASNALTPLRYGSAHRLFCACAEAPAARTTPITRGTILIRPSRSEANARRHHELAAEHVGRVNLRARTDRDTRADGAPRLVLPRRQVVLRVDHRIHVAVGRAAERHDVARIRVHARAYEDRILVHHVEDVVLRAEVHLGDI